MLLLRESEIVESAHFVGAIIRTEPGPDAAVVDHHIEPLGIVHGRTYRTDDLARRLLAVHAQDRLEIAVWGVGTAFVVTINGQPVHLALANHLLFADDGNIVFGLAGDNASIATNAGVQVDTHRPGGGSFGFPAIKVWLRLPTRQEQSDLSLLGERSVPDVFSRLVEDEIVMVGAGEIRAPFDFFQRQRIRAAGQWIKIE